MYSATARKPQGIMLWTGENSTIERDTVQCSHCGMHWAIEPGSGRERGFCMRCMHVTCGAEKCQECIPTDRKLDLHEKKGLWLF